MATNEKLITISYPASADLSADQYCVVKISSSQIALDATAGGATAFGVLQNKPSAAGQAGEVAVGGVSKVIAGGTFSAGAKLTNDASGHVVTATTGDTILGIAIADGASGKVTSMLLDNGGVSA
jgi:hypothetical protein